MKIENKNIMIKYIIVLIAMLNCYSTLAQNPLLPHVFAADPSAHIWPDDPSTLWLYTSHDEPGTNHHATMNSYHVFSTQDLINWTDHGRVLAVEDVDWAITMAWAIDAVFWKNKYYLVYCMIEKKTGMFRTGLAVSDIPQGPFSDIGFIKNVEWGQDPAIFIDNGKPYLFWGLGKKCYAGQLTDDLLTLKTETYTDLTDQLKGVFEGPWVHKYDNKYYLSYPALVNDKWPEEMCYAISDNILGPYEYKGKYISEFNGQAGTNHGSIIQFKGKWIAFHHAAWLSNGISESRNLMADFLEYNTDGTIKPIIPNKEGISGGKEGKTTIHLEAENAPKQGGTLGSVFIDKDKKGFSGSGYVTGFDIRRDYIEVLVQVANDTKANLKIRLDANSDFTADVLTGVTMMAGWDGLPIKKTNDWEVIDLGEVQLKSGDNYIRFTTQKDIDLKVDYFEIIPLK